MNGEAPVSRFDEYTDEESEEQETFIPTMKIVIPSKSSRKTKTEKSSAAPVKSQAKPVDLDGWVEIKGKYLKHLHGSWVKYYDYSTDSNDTGGFIFEVTRDFAKIRIPSLGVRREVALHDKRFYVKETEENYISLQGLMITIEELEFKSKKLLHRERELEKRMEEFENVKKIFLRNKK